jgi:hypothetical protein
MRTTLMILASSLAMACGAFEPVEGLWTVSEPTFTQDECNFSEAEDGTTSKMELTIDDEGRLSIDVDDSSSEDEPFNCELQEKRLVCPPLVEDQRDPEAGITVTFTQSLGGTFTAEDALDVNGAIELDCEGEGCALVGAMLGIDEFPCKTAFTAEATADAE